MNTHRIAIALVVLIVGALVVGAIWLMWWSTGQFFAGSRHWAAFWIVALLMGSPCSHRRCK